MKAKFSSKIAVALAGAVVIATLAAPAAAAPLVYMTGAGNPWSVPTGNAGSNDSAMDTAFGAGNWSKYNGFTMGAFGADTEFMFIDGSDGNANAFSSFLSSNQAAIQNYVAGGGRLFLNAAPNQGSTFAMGFGVTLNYPDFTGAGQAGATAAGTASGIFSGISSTYNGGWFSHASVSGAGLTSFMDNQNGKSVFAGMNFGQGYAAFGGMTLPYYHTPKGDAYALRAHMLEFVAEQGSAAADVPEPASLFLFGIGLLGAAGVSRRKRKQ